MKKQHFYWIILLFLVFGLSACSGGIADDRESDELKWVEVDLTIDPEVGQPNEPVTFTAKVTYGGEELTEVRDFSFEIWRSQDEKHEEFAGEHVGNGVFKLEKTFDREGTYYVFAHVTAKSMHNMPKEEFVIGTPSEPETGPTKSFYMDKFEEENEDVDNKDENEAENNDIDNDNNEENEAENDTEDLLEGLDLETENDGNSLMDDFEAGDE